MKIALVLPPAEYLAEKKDTPKYQHIGLGYLASMLETKGFWVKIIDVKLERMKFKNTLEAIKSIRPDILGITAMTHEINIAAEIAKAAKSLLPKIFTVIGGVHLTALPVETLRAYGHFDIGIVGEGEYSFCDIAVSINDKKYDFSHIRGVVYRNGSDILLSQTAEKVENLDSLPFPAWHLFPMATEYIIITSRGCPYSCIFCMQASGHKIRKRSIGNIVGEIEKVLAERSPERFLFYDETFTLDRTRVFEICDSIIKMNMPRQMRWSVTTRVDCVDKDLLMKMKEAGCDHIEFGIESGDQEVLDRINKRITLKDAEYAVSIAKELGFHTEGAFILGHPNETLKTAYKTICFAAKLNPHIVQLGIMVPYPGTAVAQMAREGKGGYKIISDNWSDYNKQLGNALELEELNRSDLERLQLIGYVKLFIYNRRFMDFLKFIWDYKREMLSFIKNHFKRGKVYKRSKVDIFCMVRMIFNRSPEP